MVYGINISAYLLHNCSFVTHKVAGVLLCLQLTLLQTYQHQQQLLEDTQTGNRILISFLALSIVTAITIGYLLKEQNKKEKVHTQHETEKRIARKLHDEIANEVYGIMLFVDNNEVIAGSKKEVLALQLNAIYNSTRDLSRENNEIDTGPHYPIQLKLMLKLFNSSSVSVLTKGIDTVPWEHIEPVKKITTFRVLQELMVNMKKHSMATVVLVNFETTNNRIKIIYSDNGRGAEAPSTDCVKLFGSIKDRLKNIEGEVETGDKTESGLQIIFSYSYTNPNTAW